MKFTPYASSSTCPSTIFRHTLQSLLPARPKPYVWTTIDTPNPCQSQEISPREVLASSADPRGRQTLADAAYDVDTDTGLRGGVAHDLARASYLDLAEAIATGQLRSEQHRGVGADEHANTLQSATGKSGSGTALGL